MAIAIMNLFVSTRTRETSLWEHIPQLLFTSGLDGHDPSEVVHYPLLHLSFDDAV